VRSRNVRSRSFLLIAATSLLTAQAVVFFLLARMHGTAGASAVLMATVSGIAALAATWVVLPGLLAQPSDQSADLAAEQLHLTVESGNMVGWDWDVVSGRDVWFGDLRTIFAIDARSYAGKVEDFRRRVHPDDRELVWRAVAEARTHHTQYKARFRIISDVGVTHWLEATGRFYFNPNGEAVRMLGIAADITERRQTEESLRESEARFRVMADTAPVLLWTAGVDRLCDYFNEPWLAFTGRSMTQELGNGWVEGVHPEDVKACVADYVQAFDRREPFSIEYRLCRHDGEYRWVLDNGTPRFTTDGSFAGYIGSAVDITEHKLAEQALSGLSGKLIAAQERERKGIATELHEDLGQRVALLTIHLEWLLQALPSDSDVVRSRAQELSSTASELEKDLRAIAHRLHSSTLELLGLVPAAAGLCREMSERHDVTIDFSHSGLPKKPPMDVSLALFRVLQDALTNAVTRAGVRHVAVALRGSDARIQLEVADAGAGFEPDAAISAGGLGLATMRKRLSLVGGDLVIESRPSAGTRIRASAPMAVLGMKT
jgi:PAS domain S-box-containing protein